jgi:hypothetical protein
MKAVLEMEMPDSCEDCDLCKVVGKNIKCMPLSMAKERTCYCDFGNQRRHDCPLKPIKE